MTSGRSLRSASIAVGLVTALALAACSDEANKCGMAVDNTITFAGISPQGLGEVSKGYTGTDYTRYYIEYWYHWDNLCLDRPDNQNKVACRVGLTPAFASGLPANTTLRCLVQTSIMIRPYEGLVTQTAEDKRTYWGMVENVGLYQGSQNGLGTAVGSLRFEFPALADAADSEEYAASLIESVWLMPNFQYAKLSSP